jgi:hypothetical protein
MTKCHECHRPISSRWNQTLDQGIEHQRLPTITHVLAPCWIPPNYLTVQMWISHHFQLPTIPLVERAHWINVHGTHLEMTNIVSKVTNHTEFHHLPFGCVGFNLCVHRFLCSLGATEVCKRSHTPSSSPSNDLSINHFSSTEKTLHNCPKTLDNMIHPSIQMYGYQFLLLAWCVHI